MINNLHQAAENVFVRRTSWLNLAIKVSNNAVWLVQKSIDLGEWKKAELNSKKPITRTQAPRLYIEREGARN